MEYLCICLTNCCLKCTDSSSRESYCSVDGVWNGKDVKSMDFGAVKVWIVFWVLQLLFHLSIFHVMIFENFHSTGSSITKAGPKRIFMVRFFMDVQEEKETLWVFSQEWCNNFGKYNCLYQPSNPFALCHLRFTAF